MDFFFFLTTEKKMKEYTKPSTQKGLQCLKLSSDQKFKLMGEDKVNIISSNGAMWTLIY